MQSKQVYKHPPLPPTHTCNIPKDPPGLEHNKIMNEFRGLKMCFVIYN